MRYWKKFKDKHKFKDTADVRVGVVVSTYRQFHILETLLASFQAQTHSNFRLVVAHDGPWDPQQLHDLQFKFGNDDRVTFTCSPDRMNVSGHNTREQERFDLAARTDLVGFCNGDVYYVPTYLEWMVAQMVRQSAAFGYCNMVHSHQMWKPMTTELKRGKIDVGCFLADSELVADTPWRSTEFAADWVYIRDLTKRLQKTEITKIDGFLYVHN